MIIKDIEIYKLAMPLHHPFVTALRRVEYAEDVVIKIITEEGQVGWGSAPSTPVITGDTHESIIGAIKNIFLPLLKGKSIDCMEDLQRIIHGAMLHNTSAKACVDMALYDLWGQKLKMPLYKLLGNVRHDFTSDLTISLNDVQTMVEDGKEAVARGYKDLKIKVGNDPELDLQRIKALRENLGYEVNIRLDANQGWSPKEAVKIIKTMEDMDFRIQFIEQPVKAQDMEGLVYVTRSVATPIMADEAAFSPLDVQKLITCKACDLINIKLMKTGGIYKALQIIALAEINNLKCMMGCMLESKLGVTAAAAVVGGKSQIAYADLDAGDLIAQDPINGGIIYAGSTIKLSDEPGLGIKAIEGLVKV